MGTYISWGYRIARSKWKTARRSWGWNIQLVESLRRWTPSIHPDADVDYTFAAIGVKDDEVDFSSNCGNMTSAIGPFAVDSGMIRMPDGETTVRIYNTNTSKIIHSRFLVADGEAVFDGSFAIDGVSGTAAKIELAFLHPAGSKTGKLLPTGNITDMLGNIRVSCVDAGNPCVFVQASDLQIDGTILPDSIDTHPTLLATLDRIRRKASVLMGISRTEQDTPGSIPKIALVSAPTDHILLSGQQVKNSEIDLVVRALSVGQPHRAVPITVAMACAAAASIKGSVVQKCLSSQSVDPSGITIGHSSGKILVGSSFDAIGNLTEAKVFRTARKLMDGTVYWK